VKRAALSTAGVATLLAAGTWLAAAGCLNPRPEELPSNNGAPGYSGSNETDDPGDSLTPTGSDGDVPSSPAFPNPTPGAEAPPSDEPGDAGAPDAGASDAGPRAAEPCSDDESPPETGEPPE
jgi:hypothetical protein